MMSTPKGLDLKCSEILRDSPSPPQSFSQQQLQSSPYASAFASTASSNAPSHQQRQLGSSSTSVGSASATLGRVSPQNQASSISLLVKKLDNQRSGTDNGGSIVSRVPTNDSTKISSPSGKQAPAASASASGGSLTLGLANVLSASRTPSGFSAAAYSPQAPHMFPGLPLATSAGTASIWPLVQHSGPSHYLSPSKQAIFTSTASNTQSSAKQQHGASSATMTTAVSPSKGQGSSGNGSSPIRPLTLHVSTSRGPAVLQLQQPSTASAASSSSGKQSVKLLPAISTAGAVPSQLAQISTMVGVVPSRPATASLPSTAILGGTVPTRVPVLRPSPVHPMAAATAALLSQLAPNAPAFGLVDPHSLQQQHLQAATALLRSPLANSGGTLLPHVIAAAQQIPARPAGSDRMSSGSGILETNNISSTPTKTGLGAAALVQSATATTPATTASPTRPSILRKRTTELANGTTSGSPKRSAYEAITLAKKANEKDSLKLDSDGASMASALSLSAIELPDAGNSNHSSSASTISASSAPDNGSGHSASSIQVAITNFGSGSPSPRKRPRKQQLNEFTTSRGYGSDEDATTPLAAYHCEQIEEETVVGPTGVGGLDSRYFPSTPPLQQSSLTEDLCGSKPFEKRSRTGSKSERYVSTSPTMISQRQLHERPSTSFDQLQQQIEQQRKHTPEYRPRPSLLSQYELSYDSKRYHFAVHDDVRTKDDKRSSIVELSNQKQIWQRIGGWKMHLMAVQLGHLDKDERSNLNDLNDLYEFLSTCAASSDEQIERGESSLDEQLESDALKEMVMTNIQRVRVIREQLDDAKKQLLSILKHKTNVEKLILRYSGKRPTRKKDRGKNGATASDL